jgi:hypothetical protein
MNILRVLAGGSPSVHSAWLIPLWIFNDPCSRPIPTAVGLRLLPGLLLAVIKGTLVMASPPRDPR